MSRQIFDHRSFLCAVVSSLLILALSALRVDYIAKYHVRIAQSKQLKQNVLLELRVARAMRS